MKYYDINDTEFVVGCRVCVINSVDHRTDLIGKEGTVILLKEDNLTCPLLVEFDEPFTGGHDGNTVATLDTIGRLGKAGCCRYGEPRAFEIEVATEPDPEIEAIFHSFFD